MVSQPRTHSRDSDASHAPAEDRLLEYTTAQPQKGRNKETPSVFQQNTDNTDNKHRRYGRWKRRAGFQNSGTQRGTVCDKDPGGIFCHIYPRPGAREVHNRKCQWVQVKPAGATRKLLSLGITIKSGKPEKQNNHTTAAKDHEKVYLPRIPNFPVIPNLAIV